MAQDKTDKMAAHELHEKDENLAVPEKTAGAISTRFAASLPGAVGALLVASAVAFGAGTLASFRTDTASFTGATGDTETIAPDSKGGSATKSATEGEKLHDSIPQAKGTAKPKPTEKATPAPAQEAQPELTIKPIPAPTPAPVAQAPAPPAETKKPVEQPAPKPVVTELALEAWVKGDHVKLSWTPFWGEGFEYYKLVRSMDANPTWPTGADDQLIAAIGHREETFFADKPPCGAWFFYRVFAVRAGPNGYEPLAASNAAGGGAECPPPTPATTAIALTAAFADGKVNLAWQPCTTSGFVAYKVVRSQTNADPRYPAKEGTEVIAAIGDPNVTGFVDGAVQRGQTWMYRVLAKADLGYGGFIACESPVVTVTIP